MSGVAAALRVPRAGDAVSRPLPSWLTGLVVAATLAGAVWLERRRPLRRRAEPKAEHEARNLAMSVMAAAAIRVAERPFTDRLSRIAHERRFGLVKLASLPPALEVVAAVVLLDYTLYVWHVLTHRLDFLWRFHRVHHADLDLTASTALRFHFAEMVISVPWRLAQVIVIGAAPRSLSAWQTATLVAILFHHSNVRLPLGVERRLCRVVMTPRMHGIHHSTVERERNSNWSTIFAWPDYLHGTFRLNVPQREIAIGVPEPRDPERLGLRALVRMPVASEPPPAAVAEPERRDARSLPPATLAP